MTVAAANLHLTLAFLGEVTPTPHSACRPWRHASFSPALISIWMTPEHWPRLGVVWLGCQRAPRGLLQLASLLRAQAPAWLSPEPAAVSSAHYAAYVTLRSR